MVGRSSAQLTSQSFSIRARTLAGQHVPLNKFKQSIRADMLPRHFLTYLHPIPEHKSGIFIFARISPASYFQVLCREMHISFLCPEKRNELDI